MVCADFSSLTTDVIWVITRGRSTYYRHDKAVVIHFRPFLCIMCVSPRIPDVSSPLSPLLWSAWRTCRKVSCSRALRWGDTHHDVHRSWASSFMFISVSITPFGFSLRARQFVFVMRMHFFCLPCMKYTLKKSERCIPMAKARLTPSECYGLTAMLLCTCIRYTWCLLWWHFRSRTRLRRTSSLTWQGHGPISTRTRLKAVTSQPSTRHACSAYAGFTPSSLVRESGLYHCSMCTMYLISVH